MATFMLVPPFGPVRRASTKMNSDGQQQATNALQCFQRQSAACAGWFYGQAKRGRSPPLIFFPSFGTALHGPIDAGFQDLVSTTEDNLREPPKANSHPTRTQRKSPARVV